MRFSFGPSPTNLFIGVAAATLVSLSAGCGGSTAAKPDGGGKAGTGSAGRDGGGADTDGGSAAGADGGGAAGKDGGGAAGAGGDAMAGTDGGGVAGADGGGTAGADGGGAAGVDGGGEAPDGHGFSCVPPLICPDAGAKCGSDGTCQAIYNAYSGELVLQQSCTLNASSQCLHRVALSLEYLCPNLDAWVNDSTQLDNLRSQWDAIGCSACFSTTCPTGTLATTSGLCKSTTIAGPQGPLTTVACENQP